MPLLFLLFPITGFYNGIKFFFQSKYRYGLLIFAFFYGYTVFFYSGDILIYRDDFNKIYNYTWDDFYNIFIYFNNDDLKYSKVGINTYIMKPDFYAATLGFLVSRFTENPRWFFAIVSLIYFYLMIKFLDEAVKFSGFKRSKEWRLFFLGLVFILPFYVGVSGVRFWTATFFFSWMLFKYINTAKKKYLLLTIFSILFHYTFIFPVVVTFTAEFIKINRKYFKIIILIGIAYALLTSTTSSMNFIKNILEKIDSDTITTATSGYLITDEATPSVTSVVKTVNWYVTWRRTLINFFFITFFIFDFFNFNDWRKPRTNQLFDNLYQIFFIIALFTFNLNSIGRFIYIFYFLILIRILNLLVVNQSGKFKYWTNLFFPILLMHVFVTFRAGFYTVDPFLLVSPSPALFFIHSNISLSEFLIGH